MVDILHTSFISIMLFIRILTATYDKNDFQMIELNFFMSKHHQSLKNLCKNWLLQMQIVKTH